ncbi:unnamed protein product [Darwinula stevensoni]|uniref:Peptidase M14 domain-containing protein n=1 Tax=Darwinula stevensoni TaxID=69355 RepID=A0A7R9ADE4_9CRUS|nr:unnamed protein product [Darwinula stevensoni]CAG0900709.1 unnamed protein product [Darwinula stevensoni]
MQARYTATPDDDVFRFLSRRYASTHPTMTKDVSCQGPFGGRTTSFKRGITNGAAWYPLKGGMQDYNYIWHGCMEITVELSCCKYPPRQELPRFWEENREVRDEMRSLLTYMGEAHRGVRGFVFDENRNPIHKARLKIRNREIGFETTKFGEFWRILLPGVYVLEVYKDGYEPVEREFQVLEDRPTLINITMFPTTVRDGKDWWRFRNLDPHNGGGRLVSSSSSSSMLRIRQADEGNGTVGGGGVVHYELPSFRPPKPPSSPVQGFISNISERFQNFVSFLG